ncbi:hypothetical protein EDB85DRAFT_1885232 [Lactarius pseudohatsudake]|nr:hypothetical protein EDB85DRAFT_1885232 [Lactarius pseudohatsudake]
MTDPAGSGPALAGPWWQSVVPAAWGCVGEADQVVVVIIKIIKIDFANEPIKLPTGTATTPPLAPQVRWSLGRKGITLSTPYLSLILASKKVCPHPGDYPLYPPLHSSIFAGHPLQPQKIEATATQQLTTLAPPCRVLARVAKWGGKEKGGPHNGTTTDEHEHGNGFRIFFFVWKKRSPNWTAPHQAIPKWRGPYPCISGGLRISWFDHKRVPVLGTITIGDNDEEDPLLSISKRTTKDSFTAETHEKQVPA